MNLVWPEYNFGPDKPDPKSFIHVRVGLIQYFLQTMVQQPNEAFLLFASVVGAFDPSIASVYLEMKMYVADLSG